MNKKNFAILISTSDNYLDVLDLFLEFFVKNNITRIPIYINTETKLINEIVFKFSNLNLIPINYNKPKFLGFWFDWSNRLKDALKSIDEEYILHLLDDFFIFDEIRFDRIDSILSQMRNKNLFNVQLDFRASSDIKVPKIQSICDTWLCSFQPTLWNVDFLNKLLRRHESIWAFEKHASIKAKKSGLSKFFGTVQNVRVYDFIRDDRISAVVNGKILDSQYMRSYYDLIDVDIDSLERKKISKNDFLLITNMDVILSYGPLKILIKLFKRAISRF